MTWRLPAAFALSVLVHLAVLWFWRPVLVDSSASRSIEFEMVAVRPVEPEKPPEPEPPPDPPPDLPPEPEVQEPPKPPVPDPDASEALTESEPSELEEAPAEPQPPVAVVLNLNPPAIWDSLVNPDAPTAPRSGLEFNPRLSEQVADRVRERGRIGLLTARQRMAFGLSEEVYGRTGAAGEVVKVDGQCFSLQETPEFGAEPRWWMVKCLDAKTNPFEMAPLETDARGRAIAD